MMIIELFSNRTKCVKSDEGPLPITAFWLRASNVAASDASALAKSNDSWTICEAIGRLSSRKTRSAGSVASCSSIAR